MLRHLVMFKLKPGVARDDPRVVKAVRSIERMPQDIDEVESAELGWDLSGKPHAFDYATLWLFRDRAALERYAAHPAHQKVLGETKDIFDAMIADFETP
ncbi:Dabb family protein [Mesorhizobium sp. 1B3]|uniref:Dabb family protein n=1 Tax=Mesorhizobium sp. 1B3 TaxID=3243599 RepID=UPI003D96ABBC